MTLAFSSLQAHVHRWRREPDTSPTPTALRGHSCVLPRLLVASAKTRSPCQPAAPGSHGSGGTSAQHGRQVSPYLWLLAQVVTCFQRGLKRGMREGASQLPATPPFVCTPPFSFLSSFPVFFPSDLPSLPSKHSMSNSQSVQTTEGHPFPPGVLQSPLNPSSLEDSAVSRQQTNCAHSCPPVLEGDGAS